MFTSDSNLSTTKAMQTHGTCALALRLVVARDPEADT
jgi:hypothetical protein